MVATRGDSKKRRNTAIYVVELLSQLSIMSRLGRRRDQETNQTWFEGPAKNEV